MYKIIASDQIEYGPVSGEQLRQWIAQGRANAQTKVQAEGSPDWRPLAAFPEFADVLATPAPPVSARDVPGASALPPGPPPKASGMAVASLVLGLVGLVTCGLTALVGLVLGIISLGKINRSGGRVGGQGIALAGTIVSGVCLLLLPVMAGMLLPALARAKSKAQTMQCMNNLKQLSLGLLMYAGDNKETYPAANDWCDALVKYVQVEQVFKCNAGDPAQRSHYALNARLAGIETSKVKEPARTVMVFEIQGGWNVSGGPELLLKKGRHAGAVAIAFADGHVEVLRKDRLNSLRWEP